MELEDRYIVIKKTRLTPDQYADLQITLGYLGIPTVDCVIIEKDWPEYDATVNLLWERINEL